jgi:hypothetical protein
MSKDVSFFYLDVSETIKQAVHMNHPRSKIACVSSGSQFGTTLLCMQGDKEHLKLAHLFDKPCFLGPLALQVSH